MVKEDRRVCCWREGCEDWRGRERGVGEGARVCRPPFAGASARRGACMVARDTLRGAPAAGRGHAETPARRRPRAGRRQRRMRGRVFGLAGRWRTHASAFAPPHGGLRPRSCLRIAHDRGLHDFHLPRAGRRRRRRPLKSPEAVARPPWRLARARPTRRQRAWRTAGDGTPGRGKPAGPASAGRRPGRDGSASRGGALCCAVGR